MTSPAPLAERADEIVEEFAFFDDWMDRYEYVIELGKALPPLDPAYKTDLFKIHGCQSQVWIRGTHEGSVMRYLADSDALITKGLVALLLRVLDGQPPEAIVQADLAFLDRIGMQEHLSPTRKNGLDAMIKQIKRYAESFTKIA